MFLRKIFDIQIKDLLRLRFMLLLYRYQYLKVQEEIQEIITLFLWEVLVLHIGSKVKESCCIFSTIVKRKTFLFLIFFVD